MVWPGPPPNQAIPYSPGGRSAPLHRRSARLPHCEAAAANPGQPGDCPTFASPTLAGATVTVPVWTAVQALFDLDYAQGRPAPLDGAACSVRRSSQVVSRTPRYPEVQLTSQRLLPSRLLGGGGRSIGNIVFAACYSWAY